MPKNYSAKWIYGLESPDHWISYRKQIELVLKFVKKSQKILEIGKGSGFLQNYLSGKGYSVTTLDIDQEKKPDILADAAEIESGLLSGFEAIVSFQTFEHMEYREFLDILVKMKKAGVKTIIFSVPKYDFNSYYAVFKLPKIDSLVLGFKMPLFLKKRLRGGKLPEKYHKWEINHRRLGFKRIREDIGRAGYRIIFEEQLPPRRHHCFFVLI